MTSLRRPLKRRFKISRWIYDKNQLGEVGYLTNDEIERIEKQERLRIDQRMDRLLQCFARASGSGVIWIGCIGNY